MAGRRIRSWARRCGISAPAPSAWSGTATSPNGRATSSARWARPSCTTAPATTDAPAGGHCPHCWPPATQHLLSRDALARMKPTAVLVNTSRGAVVDEDALVDALRGGRLAAAGLDVFGTETVLPDNPLLGLAH